MNRSDRWYQTFFNGLYAKVLPKTFDKATTLKQARIVRRLLKLRKGQHVLDIPCGLGRIALPLAKAGIKVTGVDLTASYLRRAQHGAKAEGLAIRFIRSDMREIDFDGEFDAAFNWFGSFGYFSDADNLAFARRVLLALKPGGLFLVEGINKSWLLAHLRPRSEQIIAGVRICHNHHWDSRTQRIRDLWTLCYGRRKERCRISMRVYDGSDIRSLLIAAGFRDIKLYGAPPLARFTRHSHRLIAVARRPKPSSRAKN